MSVTVSCVIPAYNEEESLPRSFAQIREALLQTGEPFEIIVVDDGSRDRTGDVARELCGRHQDTRLIAFTRNFGKEASIYAGLSNAAGDAVIVLDADLQHPPDLIPRMVAAWKQGGYEVIEGVKRSRPGETLRQRLFAKLFYKTLKILGDIDIDESSDFKLLDRRVVDTLLGITESRRFFRGLVHWTGFRRLGIPFDVPPRAQGTGKWNFRSLSGISWDAITSFSKAPLRIVSVLGFLTLLLSLAMVAHTLYMKLSGRAVEGFATVIIVQLVVGSAIMLSLGIVGEYLANIYLELKKRPLFIADKRRSRTGADPPPR